MSHFGKLFFVLFVSICFSGLSQSIYESDVVEYLDSAFAQGAVNGRFPGLISAYVSEDTAWTNAYGMRQWESDAPVSVTMKFQLGSVGKLLTAISVLQMVDRDKLSLDEDLRNSIPFLNAKDKITLQHLLTHSAGMNDKNIGYLERDRSEIQSLEVHLRDELPAFHQAPGISISYSNYSYALAGYMVETFSGVEFPRYVFKNISEPLGMENSYIGLEDPYLENPDYAIGHKMQNDGFIPNEEFHRSATPAGSFISNAKDIQRLLVAIQSRDTTILSSESWELLFNRSFSNHSDLQGYSLGMEEQIIDGETFWSKGGMLFGYLSQIISLPDGSLLFISQNTTDDEFLEDLHKGFLAKYYGGFSANSSNLIPVDVDKYLGEYRDARYDRDGVENIISLFRGSFTVWEGDGGIQVYHNGAFHMYMHIGESVFENQENPDQKIVFKSDDRGNVTHMYRGVNIGGMEVPTTYEKTSWYNSPTFVNEYYGFVLIFILLYGLISLALTAIYMLRRWKGQSRKTSLLPLGNHIISLIGVGLVLFHIAKPVLMLIRQTNEFLFGLPEAFIMYNTVVWLIALTVLLLWIGLVKILIKRNGTIISRILHLVFIGAISFHLFYLYYWNFI